MTRSPGSPDPGGRPAAAGVGPDGLEEALTPEQLADQWDAEKPPAAGPWANIGAAVVVIALGVFGVIGSAALGLGSVKQPESGTWPLIISLALIALGVALALTSRQMTDAEKFTGSSLYVIGGLATVVIFASVIDVIGFEIPALLLAFFWLRFLGRETWRSSIIGSVLMVVAFYAVFVLGLGVSIPHLF
jgi:putative tricarboxylic transport membrane protein